MGGLNMQLGHWVYQQVFYPLGHNHPIKYNIKHFMYTLWYMSYISLYFLYLRSIVHVYTVLLFAFVCLYTSIYIYIAI